MFWDLYLLFLLINSFVFALSCHPPPTNVLIPPTTNTVSTTTITVPNRALDFATLEIETTLPWVRASEDPNNALIPIATQLQAAQNEHFQGSPTLIDVRENGNFTNVITSIPVKGTRNEVQQALGDAFAISDYVKGFNIIDFQNN